MGDAEDLLEHMRRQELVLAVAESCTGGLLGARLTEVPGASHAFVGGVIAYADRIKEDHLGVPQRMLDASGAVSAAVAEAMADGVRKRLGADMGIAISGIAGPGGEQAGKPVGTVWIAVVGPEHLLDVQKIQVDGGRDEVRAAAVAQAARMALQVLREAELEGVADPGDRPG